MSQDEPETLGIHLRDAAKKGDLESLMALLNQGADPNSKNVAGETALHRAARYGREDCIQRLIEKGANPEAKDDDGKTAMDVARENGMENAAEVIEDFIRARDEDRVLNSCQNYILI